MCFKKKNFKKKKKLFNNMNYLLFIVLIDIIILTLKDKKLDNSNSIFNQSHRNLVASRCVESTHRLVGSNIQYFQGFVGGAAI